MTRSDLTERTASPSIDDAIDLSAPSSVLSPKDELKLIALIGAEASEKLSNRNKEQITFVISNPTDSSRFSPEYFQAVRNGIEAAGNDAKAQRALTAILNKLGEEKSKYDRATANYLRFEELGIGKGSEVTLRVGSDREQRTVAKVQGNGSVYLIRKDDPKKMEIVSPHRISINDQTLVELGIVYSL